MAREISIPGSEGTAKIRNLWAVALLPFITLGIYFWYWWYQINREMRDYGKAKGSNELGTSPGTSLLAVTLGALIVIPALVSIYNTFKRVQAAQRLAGQEAVNGWIALILFLVISPAFNAYAQSGLNGVWEKEAAPAEEAAPVEEAAPADEGVSDGPDVEPS